MDLSSFQYYQTITYTGCDQEVYQQDVVVHRSEGNAYEETVGGLNIWHVFVGDRCKNDYGDIRFTDGSGRELAYYLWPDYIGESARFCVKMEEATSDGVLVVWYGNVSMTTTSNGELTYTFFDHFEGVKIDSLRWGEWANRTPNTPVLNSVAANVGASGAWYGWGTLQKWSYPYNITMEARIKVSADDHAWNIGFDGRMGSITTQERVRILYENGAKYQIRLGDTDVYATRSPADYNNWRIARIDLTGNSVVFYKDGVCDAIYTSSLPQEPLAIVFTANGVTQYVDYVLLRVHSLNPPMVITFSGEHRVCDVPRHSVFYGSTSLMVVG